MKNVRRYVWIGVFVLLAISNSAVMAQEAETAVESSPGPMIGILLIGALVILGLGGAMASQESEDETNQA